MKIAALQMVSGQGVAANLAQARSLMQQAGRLARLGAWEDAPGRGIVYWSDICYTIHGLPPCSPLPRNYLQTFVAPPWREEMRSKMRECLRHGTEWSIVMQIQRADDGRLVWVRARGEPVVENGRIARIRGVMQDIDDSKHAEEQLRQSEEHFARIFQLVDQPMGIVRRSDGQHLIVNPAWEALTGYSAAQALGRNAIEEAERRLGMRVAFLSVSKEIAYSHQEKWDGSGYPEGLKGDAIPVSARLMAVADVYDALISKRVYKPAFPHEQACATIVKGRGTHFDPDMVDAFVAIAQDFLRISQRYPDPD